MKAFNISINGQESIIAASDNLVFVNLAYGYPLSDQIVVKGSDFLHYLTWFEGKPEKGDKVLIKVVETDKISPVLTMEDRDRNEIEKYYHQLEAELQEKGLI